MYVVVDALFNCAGEHTEDDNTQYQKGYCCVQSIFLQPKTDKCKYNSGNGRGYKHHYAQVYYGGTLAVF